MKSRFAAAMTFLAMLLVSIPAWGMSQELVVHFLDVGHADGAILQCGDEVMMIDGGNISESSMIYSYLKNTLGIEHIDYMIATHAHGDHVGGLPGAFNACSVGIVYSSVKSYDSDAFASFLKCTEEQGLELVFPEIGSVFAFGDAQVQFLSPVREYKKMNDNSIVVRIVHGENTFLFAGDAQEEAENDMLASGYDLSATVLKVGHHGGYTSSSDAFLQKVMPQYAVISCGEGNIFNYPSANVLNRFRDAGIVVYRTDLQGEITCISDGTSVRIFTERETEPDSIWRSPEESTLESEGA